MAKISAYRSTWMTVGGFIFIFIIAVFYADRRDQTTVQKAPESAYASDLYITKEGYFGAVNKEDMELMMKRIDDKEVIQKMLDAGVIFIIKEGVEVYRETVTWYGAVQLRPKGKTFTFWTFSGAIKEK